MFVDDQIPEPGPEALQPAVELPLHRDLAIPGDDLRGAQKGRVERIEFADCVRREHCGHDGGFCHAPGRVRQRCGAVGTGPALDCLARERFGQHNRTTCYRRGVAGQDFDVRRTREARERVAVLVGKLFNDGLRDHALHPCARTGDAVRQLPRPGGREIEAVGLARAKAAEELRKAVGEEGTTLVNAIDALMKGDKKIMPDILVAGSGGAIDGLASTLMKMLLNKDKKETVQSATVNG